MCHGSQVHGPEERVADNSVTLFGNKATTDSAGQLFNHPPR